MYYKVIKDGKVIDVLDRLVYVRYQKKHNQMLLCPIERAEAILSSDRKHAWHENSLLMIPVDGYDTVEIQEISQYEYDKLRCLNMQTPEEIIDAFVLTLLEDKVLWQF